MNTTTNTTSNTTTNTHGCTLPAIEPAMHGEDLHIQKNWNEVDQERHDFRVPVVARKVGERRSHATTVRVD